MLEGGSAIDMPWLASVPAVVMACYPGMVGGTALGELLAGTKNFSGKLPITWPKAESDEPQFDQDHDGQRDDHVMDYYLGYRYFDENSITPLFAFGHGMALRDVQVPVPHGPLQHGHAAVGRRRAGRHHQYELCRRERGGLPLRLYPNTAARRSVKELKRLLPGRQSSRRERRCRSRSRSASPTSNTGT